MEKKEEEEEEEGVRAEFSSRITASEFESITHKRNGRGFQGSVISWNIGRISARRSGGSIRRVT